MEDTVIKEVIKKSELVAKDAFEYQWVIYPESGFLQANIEEKTEELEITYNLENRSSLTEIREEDLPDILLILDDIGNLKKYIEKYSFSLNPQNLFYDCHGSVKAKRRDMLSAGTNRENQFLNSYKAVIGYALQNKYTFDDFLQGGMQLLGKEGLLGKIQVAISTEEIQQKLRDEYERIKKERKEKKVLLQKNKVTTMKVTAAVLGTILVGIVGYLGYDCIVKEPYQKAVINLSDAYIQSDYVACIDYMKKIKVEKMTSPQKYMLANAYVRSENLTQEQKDNILTKMTLNDIESKLDYWIYLGRRDIEQAVDIAMRLSDDQLLLYAYMKEKAITEEDTELTGTEKSEKLEGITKKMEPLMEKYDTEDTDNSENRTTTEKTEGYGE